METKTVEGGTIPVGAQRVEMLRLTLSASCDAPVALESITVHRAGLGVREDISAVYILSGTTRLTDGRTFDSKDHTAELRFRGVTIDACDSMDLSVLIDISSDAAPASEHRIDIRSGSDIQTSAREVRLQAAKEVTPRRTGGTQRASITVETLQLTNRVSYGPGRTVGRFRISSRGQTNQVIEAITFTNGGSARDGNLLNLYIQGNRTVLTSVAKRMTGDRVRLLFSPPLILENSQSRVFELVADVRASRSRTIRFTVEESADVEAVPVARRL